MLDLVTNKVHDEERQGEAFEPFALDPNNYQKKFYIESYGCAMNFSDSEIVASILNQHGFGATRIVEEADLVLLNTCSIREKAEQTVRKRLTEFRKLKEQKKGMLVGVLGCMAERLKSSNWELKPVLSELLKSEVFFDEGNIGAEIKSPYEYMLMTLRSLEVPITNLNAANLLVYGQASDQWSNCICKYHAWL